MGNKNVNWDVLADCWLCAHSQSGTDRTSHYPRLICSLTLKAAGDRCDKFELDQGEENAESIG